MLSRQRLSPLTRTPGMNDEIASRTPAGLSHGSNLEQFATVVPARQKRDLHTPNWLDAVDVEAAGAGGAGCDDGVIEH